MKNDSLDYRSPEWVAEQLGIDKNTVYKFLQDGLIPALQLGRKWLISERDLNAWLAEETHRQTEARRHSADSVQRTSKKLGNMDSSAKQLVKAAHSEARRFNHKQLGQGHLLLALGECADLKLVLDECTIDMEDFRRLLEDSLPVGEGVAPRRLGRTAEAKAAMKAGEENAARNGRRQLSPWDLLWGLVELPQGIAADYLRDHGLTKTKLMEVQL